MNPKSQLHNVQMNLATATNPAETKHQKRRGRGATCTVNLLNGRRPSPALGDAEVSGSAEAGRTAQAAQEPHSLTLAAGDMVTARSEISDSEASDQTHVLAIK